MFLLLVPVHHESVAHRQRELPQPQQTVRLGHGQREQPRHAVHKLRQAQLPVRRLAHSTVCAGLQQLRSPRYAATRT